MERKKENLKIAIENYDNTYMLSGAFDTKIYVEPFYDNLDDSLKISNEYKAYYIAKYELGD